MAKQEIVVPLVLEGKPYSPLGYAHIGGFSRKGVDAAWFKELQETYEIVDKDNNRTFYMIPSTSRHGKRFYIENGVVRSYDSGITIDFEMSGGKTLTITELKRE